MTDMSGRIAIVTGGTQGLGQAVAERFAADGAAGIALVGRNGERGERVAESLSGKGCPARFIACDLADIDAVKRVVPEAVKAFGRVDALVNAAAITDRGTVFDTSPELFDRMFAVNVRAPYFLMQDALTVMRDKAIEGTVVNILSMSSHGGQPFISAYCGSKGALATLTKNVAYSVMRHRIRVNGLNIGWMNSPGEDRIQREFHGADEGWLADAVRDQPFGRLIEPAEVAGAVAFLSSPESGMMTGSIIDFDQSVVGCYDAPPQPQA
jgi:NAD(P)-dependent dehydrogenase (short-subunit alcohol dehydrogenase family)